MDTAVPFLGLTIRFPGKGHDRVVCS